MSELQRQTKEYPVPGIEILGNRAKQSKHEQQKVE